MESRYAVTDRLTFPQGAPVVSMHILAHLSDKISMPHALPIIATYAGDQVHIVPGVWCQRTQGLHGPACVFVLGQNLPAA